MGKRWCEWGGGREQVFACSCDCGVFEEGVAGVELVGRGGFEFGGERREGEDLIVKLTLLRPSTRYPLFRVGPRVHEVGRGKVGEGWL